MPLPWVRMDTQWPQNPKFLQLIEERKFRAIAVYWGGLGWSGAHGHAGWVATAALPIIHGTRRDATHLVDVGLWEPSEGGWSIHDWSEYQPTNEEHQRRSDRARAAAQKRWANQ